MGIAGHIFLSLLMVLLAGYFSGSETGGYVLNRIRLGLRTRGKRSFSARVLSRLLEDEQSFVIAALVGTNACVFGASALLTDMFRTTGWHVEPELASTLVLSPVLFLFAEVIPKELFRRHSDALMYATAGLLEVCFIIFRPVTFPMRLLTRWSSGISSRWEYEEPLLGREQIKDLLQEVAEQGVLTDYQKTVAYNIMKLRGLMVEDVMIPLDEAAAVPVSATGDEVRGLAGLHNYSRFPVYEGKTSNVVGVISLVSLAETGHNGLELRKLMREPVRLAPDTNVEAAMYKLQKARQPMGIVTDLAGRAVGMVTLKDLVEEIVGELQEW